MPTTAAKKKRPPRKRAGTRKQISNDAQWSLRRARGLQVLQSPALARLDWLVHGFSTRPGGESVLSQVAEAGYAGIDLGPVGYLGSGDELGEALARRGLGLAGAYVELPYSDPDALEERRSVARDGRPNAVDFRDV